MKCFRPIDRCLCHFVTPPIDAGVKFIFLMHPKEAKRNRTGTGRIAHTALAHSEILMGIDFSKDTRLQTLLSDARYLPMLLYPGENAITAAALADASANAEASAGAEASANAEASAGAGVADNAGTSASAEALVSDAASPSENVVPSRSLSRIPLVIVIDATWFCARKVIEHSPFLLDLPRISFAGDYRSIFTFKREPRPEYISTIESCYYLIREMQTAGIVATSVNAEPLMAAFKEMIRQQLQAENDRIAGKLPDTHSYNWKYKKTREIPEQLITKYYSTAQSINLLSLESRQI